MSGQRYGKSLKSVVLQAINEECCICNVTKHHDTSFDTGDGAFGKNSPNSQSSMPDPISTHRSKLVMPVRCNGVMEALHPNTKNTLNKLLPTTLPMAISGFFFKAATMDVASSGSDVPPATNVSPITDSLTPRLRAMPLAPSTKKLPPAISAPSPPRI